MAEPGCRLSWLHDVTDAGSYEGRGQTLVKHLILRSYLQRFARIIAFNWSVITYVDCFSGPWQSRADDLSDTSFAIALEELRRARSTHRERKGKDLTIRCLFMERDRRAYERLEAFAKAATDLEIATVNASFEDAIDRIVGFARQKGAFTFFFIDPTGWKHLSLPLITPLLSLRPCEVLVNLMTGHVRRFVGSPDKRTQESLKPLFLDGDYPTKFEGLTGTDLDDAVVDRYCRGLAKAGGLSHF